MPFRPRRCPSVQPVPGLAADHGSHSCNREDYPEQKEIKPRTDKGGGKSSKGKGGKGKSKGRWQY